MHRILHLMIIVKLFKITVQQMKSISLYLLVCLIKVQILRAFDLRCLRALDILKTFECRLFIFLDPCIVSY